VTARSNREQGRARYLTAELASAFLNAEKPLSLGELSERLGRPFRSVAVALSAACRAGDVDRLEGGLYSLRSRPSLADLFAFVHAREAEWELDDRLRLLDPAHHSD